METRHLRLHRRDSCVTLAEPGKLACETRLVAKIRQDRHSLVDAPNLNRGLFRYIVVLFRQIL